MTVEKAIISEHVSADCGRFEIRQLRVLFFEPYPMGTGGNFQTQLGFLRFLTAQGGRPLVLAPSDGIALNKFREIGVECAVMPPPASLSNYGGAILRKSILGSSKASFDLIRYNLRIASFLRDQRIDVVYANCVRAALSVGIGAKIASRPMLLYIKGELTNPVIDRISFRLADRILFFCERNRDDRYPKLMRRMRHKVDILKIGFDQTVIRAVEGRDRSAVRADLNFDSGRVNCIVLGQLYPPKGQHLAIEALAAVARDFPNTHLYIVGDEVIREYCDYRPRLEALVHRYGLEKNVTFTGWRSDALDIVAAMDVVLHPSLSEGFGRAVLESMALGKPVIASKVGGLREAIRDGENGFLVDPGDTAAIACRWRDLLADETLRSRLGREAKRTVFAEYLADDKNARFADILCEMGCGSH